MSVMDANLFSVGKLSLQRLRDEIWIFPPNESCNWSNAWWVETSSDPVLVDCPAITESSLTQLKKLACGRKPTIMLTNKYSHGDLEDLLSECDWPVLIQEQEAYLLPTVRNLETFAIEHITSSGFRLLWTPGPTPGSCVLLAPPPINVLFCGRLLIPVASDQLSSLRTKKTFHWTTYQKSLSALRNWIPRDRLLLLASGVSSRANAYGKLWDLDQCQSLNDL